MSGYFRRLSNRMKKNYAVDIELKIEENVIHAVRVTVPAHSKRLAYVAAHKEMAKALIITAVGAHRVKSHN